jgi:hypothetical protein
MQYILMGYNNRSYYPVIFSLKNKVIDGSPINLQH